MTKPNTERPARIALPGAEIRSLDVQRIAGEAFPKINNVTELATFCREIYRLGRIHEYDDGQHVKIIERSEHADIAVRQLEDAVKKLAAPIDYADSLLRYVYKLEHAAAKTAAMAPQDGLREAAVLAHRVLANLTDPAAIKTTAVITAFAQVCEAELALRQALAASPAAQHEAMAPAGVQNAGGEMTSKTPDCIGDSQNMVAGSDAEVAREILDKCVNVFRGHMIDSYNYEKATDLITQHVEARTKPLVEALEAFPIQMMVGHDDKDIAVAIIKWLPVRAKALAQEKGLRDV